MATFPPRSTVAARDAFLAHFPTTHRSFITNAFLFAVRRGMRTPSTILASVEDELNKCITWGLDHNGRYAEALTVIAAHRGGAFAFAEWALSWKALTPAEKERYRGDKSEQYRQAWMEQQPATEKQIAYVRALGYRGEVTSKAHASEVIERLKSGRRAA